ncbi:potassium transporter Trk [Microbacterium deminutum]|uniref:Potassium transporter Trk n=1 Tax=Microbacterium deminutum TaxID=344164 RepID=A0ABN2QMB0_9MICO
MGQHIDDHVERVRVRRAPKFSVFLLAGVALGLLVALILTFAFSGTAAVSPNTGLLYSQGQVFGFLALACITAGLALGGVVALIFDRRSSRHTREVIVDHLSVHPEE